MSWLAARAQDSRLGKVVGKVIAYKINKSGNKVYLKQNLGNYVIYLIPEDHQVETKIPAAHARVSQKNAKFSPELLVIPLGQTVDFPNDDSIDHNVFSFSKAKKFDLGVYPKGVMKSVAFDKPGPILLFCSVHESMNGVIYVAPNQLFTTTNQDGSFTINRVPVGKYKLNAWSSTWPESMDHIEVREVDVQEGKPIQVEIDLTPTRVLGGKAL